MSGKIYLDIRENEVEAAIISDGELVKREIFSRNSKVGNIYRGKVMRVTNGAFVDIGGEKDGFLPVKNHKPGEYLTVMVLRDENGVKGCLLTENLTVEGKFAVITEGKVTKFSRKLSEERKGTLPKIEGVVFRSACECAKNEEILSEIEENRRILDNIKREGQNLFRVTALYSVDPVERAKNIGYGEICENFEEIRDKIAVLQERIVLNNGAELVFDKTEAMTVIDVNSRVSENVKDEENFNFQIDIIAAKEAAKQIILRDIGGLIAIDFINIFEEKHYDALFSALKEGFADDRQGTRIEFSRQFCVALISRKKI